jgi:hypothetical protein
MLGLRGWCKIAMTVGIVVLLIGCAVPAPRQGYFTTASVSETKKRPAERSVITLAKELGYDDCSGILRTADADLTRLQVAHPIYPTLLLKLRGSNLEIRGYWRGETLDIWVTENGDSATRGALMERQRLYTHLKNNRFLKMLHLEDKPFSGTQDLIPYAP